MRSRYKFELRDIRETIRVDKINKELERKRERTKKLRDAVNVISE